MSLFGRAAAGLGEAAVDIGNKYLDQNLQLLRAQALADIQRESNVKQAGQLADMAVDPTRRAASRTQEGLDTESKLAAQLKGKKAEAIDTELTAAEATREGALTTARATATATASAEALKKYGNDPLMLKAMSNEARAKHITGEGEAASAASARFALAQAKKVADLHDTLLTAVTTGDKGLEEQTRDQIAALTPGKDSKATEFYKVAENAAKVMGPAQKILADSGASPEAKTDAEQTIREQRALMNSAAKRAGVDLTEAAKVPEPQDRAAAMAALKAGAKLEDINARRKANGYALIEDPNPKKAPAAPVAPAVEQAPDYLNEAGKAQWLRDKPARDKAEEERKKKEREQQGRTLMDAARNYSPLAGD